MAKSQGAHVLVFPYPAQGHMLPLLDLAHQLAVQGLTITVLVTPKNLPLLDPLLARSPTVQTLVLPFPDHHNPSLLPHGVENTKDLPPSYFIPMIHVLGGLHQPLLAWARSQPSPPHAILSDFFLGWTHHLATELGIPRLVFSPSGALTISLVHALWRDMPWRDDPSSPVPFPNIPKSPIYPWYQLSPIYRSYREGDPVWEFIKEGFLGNIASWGFVFNTFAGLEGEYLDHVRRDLGHERVWAVGPLSPLDGPAAGRGGPSSVPAEEVLTWLDGCGEGTVVYVCFGSQVELTWQQAEAVSAGLERSGARFVWCVRGSTAVPEGYVERLKGRGMVIRGWAPQVAVLGHRAVGAFLTHCGWNSVLEGIAAGVPLLTWPMGADQFLNARLLVEDAGVGVRVCEGRDTVPDPDELGRVIAESVGGAREERARKAEELRKESLEAVREGGSSFKDLEGLVEELSRLKMNERSTD